MNTPLPIRMPRVRAALRVEQAVVVDDDVVADVDLVGMPQHDVLAEDDVAAAAAEQHRVEGLAERQTERAGHALREQHDELVLEQRRQPGPADDQRAVFGAGAAALAKELVLRARDVADRRGFRSIRAHGTTPASARCLRAARPSARSRARGGRGRCRTRGSCGRSLHAGDRSGARSPNGAQTASQTAPASQTGQTGIGSRRVGAGTRATSAVSCTSWPSVVTSPPARM